MNPKKVLEPRPDRSPNTSPSSDESDVSLQSSARRRGSRQQQVNDRDDVIRTNVASCSMLAKTPPPAPPRHVVARSVSTRSRCSARLGRAGDGLTSGDVAAHPEALVPDPVRLDQVSGSAPAGEARAPSITAKPSLGSRDPLRQTTSGGPATLCPDREDAATTNSSSTAASPSASAPSPARHRRRREVMINPITMSMRGDEARSSDPMMYVTRVAELSPTRARGSRIGQDGEHQPRAASTG